jgi:hypothetical protein
MPGKQASWLVITSLTHYTLVGDLHFTTLCSFARNEDFRWWYVGLTAKGRWESDTDCLWCKTFLLRSIMAVMMKGMILLLLTKTASNLALSLLGHLTKCLNRAGSKLLADAQAVLNGVPG